MKFLQKYVYVIATIILVSAFFIGKAIASNQQLQCQSGEYDAGGFCRTVPTGCPYGDSIPLDSPKCVPDQEEVANTPEPQIETVKPEVTTCQQ